MTKCICKRCKSAGVKTRWHSYCTHCAKIVIEERLTKKLCLQRTWNGANLHTEKRLCSYCLTADISHRGNAARFCEDCAKNRYRPEQTPCEACNTVDETKKKRKRRWCDTCVPSTNGAAISRWKNHRITQPEFEKFLSLQDEKCPICKKVFDKINVRHRVANQAVVDHCHVTNKIRGLLCSSCNFAIGHFDKIPNAVHNLTLYLEETK